VIAEGAIAHVVHRSSTLCYMLENECVHACLLGLCDRARYEEGSLQDSEYHTTEVKIPILFSIQHYRHRYQSSLRALQELPPRDLKQRHAYPTMLGA
jgi:hypothetical protein